VGSSRDEDRELRQFDRFLREWSRRDFLRGMGGAVAMSALMTGGMELLAACGGGTSSTAQNAVRGGHLVEGSISDISNINPIFSNDTTSNNIGYLCYPRLVVADGNGNLQPDLAAEVPKVDSDQVTYRFKLRDGLKWSDGQALTADDVVYTYQLMYDPKYKAVVSRYRAQLEQHLASVTSPDPRTVVFKTTSAYAPFLISFAATVGIIPKHVYEKLQPAEINSTELNQVPQVVSGVMIPVKWDKGAQYQLKRNDLFFRGKALLDSYTLKVVPDAVQVANQLRTHELDVGQPDASQWDSLANVQGLDRVSFVQPQFDYYLQNMDPAKTPKAAIFMDADVRHALLMAVDRKKVAEKVYFGQAVAADSSVSSVQWVHTTPKAQYPFDLKKAQNLLDTAGWAKGSDGIRAKNGVRMEWEIRTNSGNKVRETLITVLADQWSQLGAHVTTRLVQFPQLVTQLSQTRDFEMILLGINEGLDPDTTQLWSSKSIGGGALNGSGYRNPKVDALLDQATQVLERDKRKPLYAQIQQALMEDLPAPLVTYPKSLWGVSKRVKNFNVAPWNVLAPRPWFKDVYVTDGK
jgi:peptide/nickel transport system substrate-binding protein